MKTVTEFKNSSDKFADISTKIYQLESNQTAEINAVRARYKKQIDALKKSQTNNFKRLCTWLKNSREKLFSTGKTGVAETNQCIIKVAKNPPMIEPIDKDRTDEEAINQLGKLNLNNCIKTKHEVDIESLERLSDDELKQAGYKRVRSTQASITLKANKDIKKSSKLKS